MKQDNRIKLLNGYFEIDMNLQKKLDNYMNCSMTGLNINKLMTWSEFFEIFSHVSCLFNLKYKDNELTMINEKKECWCTIDYVSDMDIKHFNYEAKTPNELINKIKIGNKTLIDVWDEIIID